MKVRGFLSLLVVRVTVRRFGDLRVPTGLLHEEVLMVARNG